MLPVDDFILLSVVNTKLRDEYSSLEDLCAGEGADGEEIVRRLSLLGYRYDREKNAFSGE